MKTYIVRETVTLIRRIEAETKEAAISKARDKGIGDFEGVDCSLPERFEATEIGEDETGA